MTKPYFKEIVIKVEPSYVPEDGDAFDAVVCALDHFEIPACVVERDPGVKARIVIGLEDGLVSSVTANVPLDYVVYDYDTEGCSEDELATRPAIDAGEVQVYAAGYYAAAVDSAKIAEIFEVVSTEAGKSGACDDCGAEVESVIGCPDGAELCRSCFEAGGH